MTPEDLASKVLVESDMKPLSFSHKFHPTLEIRYNTQNFKKKTKYSKYGYGTNDVIIVILLIRSTFVDIKFHRSCFSDEEWNEIPKKLNKGLLRLHDKGKLIPLIEVQTLL